VGKTEVVIRVPMSGRRRLWRSVAEAFETLAVVLLLVACPIKAITPRKETVRSDRFHEILNWVFAEGAELFFDVE